MQLSSTYERTAPSSMDIDTFFNTIYDQTYQDMLKLVVIKTNSASHIDDILQNIYKNLYVRISKKGFKDIRSPRAFVFRLAKKELSRHYKSKAEQRENETGLEGIGEAAEMDGIPFEQLIERQEVLELIGESAKKLPLLSYKSFILFYYYDMPIVKIAECLHISEDNVKTRLMRARNAVRKDLQGGIQ